MTLNNIISVYPTIKPIFTGLYNWIISNYIGLIVACFLITVISLIILRVSTKKKYKDTFGNIFIFTILFSVIISILVLFNYMDVNQIFESKSHIKSRLPII